MTNYKIISKTKCKPHGQVGWVADLPHDIGIFNNKILNNRSNLMLFEDDQELWFRSSDLYNIGRFGRGRFNFIDNKLYFSASDNSSIINNNRQYKILAYESDAIMPSSKAPLPIDVGIEITNICNAKCIYCPLYHNTENKLKYPLTYMDIDLFKKIIDEISKWSCQSSIYLNNGGEPLLDKELKQKIEYCVRKGVSQKILLQTNAQYLTNDTAQMLLDAGIHLIIAAFDGASKDTFETHRINCDYNVVLNNLKRFSVLRDSGNYSTGIRIKFMRTKLNEHEIISTWKLFSAFLNHENDSFQEEIAHTWNEDCLKNNPTIYADNNCRSILRPCRMANTYLPIFANGYVGGCSIDYNNDLYGQPLGDANRQSLYSIWYGHKFSRIRFIMNLYMKHPHNRILKYFLPEKCQRCYLMFFDDTVVSSILPHEYLLYKNFTSSVYKLLS